MFQGTLLVTDEHPCYLDFFRQCFSRSLPLLRSARRHRCVDETLTLHLLAGRPLAALVVLALASLPLSGLTLASLPLAGLPLAVLPLAVLRLGTLRLVELVPMPAASHAATRTAGPIATRPAERVRPGGVVTIAGALTTTGLELLLLAAHAGVAVAASSPARVVELALALLAARGLLCLEVEGKSDRYIIPATRGEQATYRPDRIRCWAGPGNQNRCYRSHPGRRKTCLFDWRVRWGLFGSLGRDALGSNNARAWPLYV